MKEYNIIITGGGPAGLRAAIEASKYTDKILVIDENIIPGGQLSKQTHKFFGSKNHFASTRGINICNKILKNLDVSRIEFIKCATVTGFYKPNIIVYEKDEKLYQIKGKKFIFATGAMENIIPFENNDLPGVYGAGAVQTLMNLYGVKPAENVLMVGAGNIGLIVSYQLLQAGVKVKAVIEASENIGGYHVHAAKLRRMGVPILTNHSIKKVFGDNKVKNALVAQVDKNWNIISGTEKEFEVDAVCLAVGLTPSSEILHQAGCELTYVKELCGYVAKHDKYMETNIPGVFVAGDVSGIEEASAAMLEGKMAGLKAAYDVENFNRSDFINFSKNIEFELNSLRTGPFGNKAMIGKAKIKIEREER